MPSVRLGTKVAVIDARAREVGRLTAENRLIAVMTWKDYARGGGLMSYGLDLAAL
jgi:hypothetical protein